MRVLIRVFWILIFQIRSVYLPALDKNVQLTPLMSSVGFGFETGGSVTLGERKGNARPWFYRLPKTQSLVVHAGLANRGIVNSEVANH